MIPPARHSSGEITAPPRPDERDRQHRHHRGALDDRGADDLDGGGVVTPRVNTDARVATESRAPPRSVVALRHALILFAVAVTVQAALGFAGALSAAPFALAGLVVVWLIHRGLARRQSRARPPEGGAAAAAVAVAVAPFAPASAAPERTPEPWSVADVVGASALVAAFVERTWAGLHRATFLYDVLSYHLHVPAAWRAAGAVRIIPTPFGDPAPAYAPSNAELVYHLFMAATGNATLAHAGQIPFALLATLAIYATARVLGAARAVGFAAALAFLLVPEVWQQAPTAMADLAMAAAFLSALPFLLRIERDRVWPDVAALGMALGLMLGTKYVATVMGLPLLAWTAVAISRRRPRVPRTRAVAVAVSLSLLAITSLMIACGGFWYVRNALATGNPLYPATLRFGPFTLAPGLYDRATVETSPYHLPVRNLAPLAAMFVEAGVCWTAGVALAALAAWRTRWPALMVVLLLLFWFATPYQESRFLLAVWGVAAIVMASAARRLSRAGPAVLLAVGAGSILEFPTAGRGAVLLVATLVATLAAVVARSSLGTILIGAARRHRSLGPLFWPAAGALVVGGAIIWARARDDGDVPRYTIGDHHDAAWRWTRAHLHRRRVAYAGSNLPFPLWGPALDNEVRYVNVSGGPEAAAHDFPAAPAPAEGPPSAEPAPERQRPARRDWLANLDALGIDTLFVTALYPAVARTIAHDADGFPIERAWADALPDRFTLAFSDDAIRVYELRRGPPNL